jgi:NADH-quinone oxidoreductase subunit M
MPFAGLAFGLGLFAAIGLPGFANFAGEIMIFFGAFRNGWEIGRFHIFQIATVLALWGVVLSTVYMLRAYRKTFMGSIREQWQKLPDLSPTLRVPVTLLVAALLCLGFLPQFFVRNVAPMFGTFLPTQIRRPVATALCAVCKLLGRPENTPHRGVATASDDHRAPT